MVLAKISWYLFIFLQKKYSFCEYQKIFNSFSSGTYGLSVKTAIFNLKHKHQTPILTAKRNM